jgi:hypothetical protein
MKRISGLVVFLIFAASAIAEAQPANGKVLIKGSGAPVAQALIDFSCPSTKQRAVTADDGSYYLEKLPAASYSVTVTYRGNKYQFNRTIPEGGLSFEIAP